MCRACPQYEKDEFTKSMKHIIFKSVLKKKKEKHNMPRLRIKPYSDKTVYWPEESQSRKKSDRILSKKQLLCSDFQRNMNSL